MTEGSKEHFDAVVLAFVAIAIACAIFGSLAAGLIPAKEAGIALVSWAATGHVIALICVITQRETNAAVVLFVFMGFWICVGLGLNFLSSHGLHKLLVVIEPTLLFITLLWQFLYRDKKKLRSVLLGLAWVILWLFLSKFVPQLSVATPYWVWALGLYLLILAFCQRLRAQRHPSG